MTFRSDTGASWYWVEPKNFGHSFKLVKTGQYDAVAQKSSYVEVGVMAMDNFGDLVLVRPPVRSEVAA